MRDDRLVHVFQTKTNALKLTKKKKEKKREKKKQTLQICFSFQAEKRELRTDSLSHQGIIPASDAAKERKKGKIYPPYDKL